MVSFAHWPVSAYDTDQTQDIAHYHRHKHVNDTRSKDKTTELTQCIASFYVNDSNSNDQSFCLFMGKIGENENKLETKGLAGNGVKPLEPLGNFTP